MNRRLDSRIVWATFAASAGGAALFVHLFAGRVPVVDDYFYLDLWLDPGVPSWRTLWSPLNEHRLPLPKLATWLTARALGPQLKNVMAVDLAALVVATAYSVRRVRLARGQYRISDAFLPLTLLSVGHAESLLWAVQVNFYAPLVLALVALARLAGVGERASSGDVGVVGVAAVGLTLSGVQGVVVAAPLAGWLLVAARDPGAAARWLALLLATLTLGLVALVAAGHDSPPHHAPPRLDALSARFTLRVLGGGWGPAGERSTPAEPTAWPALAGLATAALVLTTLLALALDARRPARRLGSLGLVAFALGYLILAAGVGTGRAALTGGELANRYMTLMLPLPVWAYAAWVRLGGVAPRAGRVVCGGLASVSLASAWPNAAEGLRVARDAAVNQALVERDVLLGVPAEYLDSHHAAYLFPPGEGVAGPGLERLRRAGVRPFDKLAPPVALTPTPIEWAAVGVAPEPVAGVVTAGRAECVQFTIRFATPTAVEAVAIEYELACPLGRVDSEAAWDLPRAGGALPRLVRKPLTPGVTTRKLWLGRGVREVAFVVRGPAALKFVSATGLK